MVPSFLEPTPVTLRSLVVWDNFLAQVEFSLERDSEALSSAVIAAAASVRELEAATTKALEDTLDQDDLRFEVIRQVLTLQMIRAYVSDPMQGKAFLIEPYIWGLVPVETFDFDETVQFGRLTFDAQQFPEGSLERRMANLPLWVHGTDLKKLFDLKASSVATAREAAQSIIEVFRTKTPEARMRRVDFIDSLQEQASVSKRQAEKLWAEFAPDDWKRPGTKSPGGRDSRHSN